MSKKGQTFEKNAKVENLLIDFMIGHKGIEQAVSSKELCIFLAEKGLLFRQLSYIMKAMESRKEASL